VDRHRFDAIPDPYLDRHQNRKFRSASKRCRSTALLGTVYIFDLYLQEVFELVEKVLFMLHQQHQALHADNKQGRQIHFILIRIQAVH
jgi:hypothetical protein